MTVLKKSDLRLGCIGSVGAYVGLMAFLVLQATTTTAQKDWPQAISLSLFYGTFLLGIPGAMLGFPITILLANLVHWINGIRKSRNVK